MAGLTLIPQPIDGLMLFEPKVHGDARGYFLETYNLEEMRTLGLEAAFVQDNESKSVRGVLRGLHAQTNKPQGKLVRVIHGEVFDVAVDLRRNSPSYGKWQGVWLSGENKRMFYLPQGFAHGFLVTSEEAVFVYKCTELYNAASDGGIRYDDPEIGVDWPLDRVGAPLLSEKDQRLGGFGSLSFD